MKKLKIVFMGTPDFAVPCLDILVRHGYDIVGVITSTDKFGGRRNKKLLESAVKEYALKQKLLIMQPKNLKSKSFNRKLKSLGANLQIVVAFRMLPEMVWNMPEYGTYNLHGSLLPQYRGAAPINWAMINNETKTGVTSFKLKHEIDTGDIAFKKMMPIYFYDSVKQVHDRMQDIAAETVLKTVQAIERDNIKFTAQIPALASHAPKLFPNTCQLDLSQTSESLYHLIRSLNPFPTAWTTLEGKKLKVYEAEAVQSKIGKVGDFITDNKSYIRLCCADGFLDIRDLQLEGKKRMTVRDFLNGYTLDHP